MVPEPGQLVHVRQRPFVVESVLASAGLPDVLRQDGLTRSQHLVTLSSIEDDALGESLRVIWEVEPGASIRERGHLPVPTNGFDDPATLDAFLDAVRWGAVSSADMHALQSPFRSGIRIEDYHLEPVVRAIQMPRVARAKTGAKRRSTAIISLSRCSISQPSLAVRSERSLPCLLCSVHQMDKVE
jgi:hypothetical protein